MPEKKLTEREKLVARVADGARPSYELFFGGWCSQWAPAAFTVDGETYPTAEHFMMAEKARTFSDWPALETIRRISDPAIVKGIGRTVRGYDEATWAAIRYDVVVTGNRAKFGQNPDARQYLLDTGDRIIVECSPVDRIWGIGLEESDPRCRDPRRWRGENLLGFAIMQVRDELRAAAAAPRAAGGAR